MYVHTGQRPAIYGIVEIIRKQRVLRHTSRREAGTPPDQYAPICTSTAEKSKINKENRPATVLGEHFNQMTGEIWTSAMPGPSTHNLTGLMQRNADHRSVSATITRKWRDTSLCSLPTVVRQVFDGISHSSTALFYDCAVSAVRPVYPPLPGNAGTWASESAQSRGTWCIISATLSESLGIFRATICLCSVVC